MNAMQYNMMWSNVVVQYNCTYKTFPHTQQNTCNTKQHNAARHTTNHHITTYHDTTQHNTTISMICSITIFVIIWNIGVITHEPIYLSSGVNVIVMQRICWQGTSVKNWLWFPCVGWILCLALETSCHLCCSPSENLLQVANNRMRNSQILLPRGISASLQHLPLDALEEVAYVEYI